MYKIDAVVPVGDGKKLFFCYFRKYFFRFRAIQTFTKFDAKIQSLREKLRKYVFLVFFLRNFLLYSTILREVFWPAWGWRHSGEIMPKPRVAFPESHFKIRERRFSRHRASTHKTSVVDPDPHWIRIQELCGSGSVFPILCCCAGADFFLAEAGAKPNLFQVVSEKCLIYHRKSKRKECLVSAFRICIHYNADPDPGPFGSGARG